MGMFGLAFNVQSLFQIVKAVEWVPYVPLPANVYLEFWMKNQIAYINISILFPYPCFHILSWGDLTRDGNILWVDSEIWRLANGCPTVLMWKSHTYELGHLEIGSYTFTFEAWGSSVKSTSFTVPVVAAVDIHPDTLNLKSKGKWITAYIQLPEGYNPEDIDATTILLNETIQPVLDPKYDFVTNSSEYLVDHYGDGILDRMVKFNRTEVASWICSDLGIQYGNVTLTITGEVDGTPFEGTDRIKVLFPGDVDDDGAVTSRDFSIFAGCYGMNIENPSYNPLADFNEDGCINSEDFSILSGNYGKTAV